MDRKDKEQMRQKGRKKAKVRKDTETEERGRRTEKCDFLQLIDAAYALITLYSDIPNTRVLMHLPWRLKLNIIVKLYSVYKQ